MSYMHSGNIHLGHRPDAIPLNEQMGLDEHGKWVPMPELMRRCADENRELVKAYREAQSAKQAAKAAAWRERRARVASLFCLRPPAEPASEPAPPGRGQLPAGG